MAGSILVVEDSRPMRAIILSILEEECDVVGQVEDGTKVIAQAMRYLPETILLDISLPGVSGLALLLELRPLLPKTVIIMLTNHSDETYRQEAFARGADAYVLKSRAHTELLPAIRKGRSAARGDA